MAAPAAAASAAPTAEKELQDILATTAKLEERATQLRSTINKDYQQIDELVKEINKQKKALREWKSSALNGKPKGSSLPTETRGVMARITESLDKLRRGWEPETGSLFVRFFLGQVNVKQYRDGERNVLKLEYEKFKERTNFILLAFVLAQLFVFQKFRVIEISFQVWLLYYYVSLALRENILRVNGSNIKPWWIIHHYLSIVTSLVFIMFPQSEYEYFQTGFLYFSLLQSGVQNLMNRYQSVQLYKNIAMGKADRMDVTGDGGSIHLFSWAPTAVVLLPFLLLFQLSQLFISWLLLEHYLGGHRMWQVLAGGILFAVLGIGNISSTLETYISKGLFKSSESSKSKHN